MALHDICQGKLRETLGRDKKKYEINCLLYIKMEEVSMETQWADAGEHINQSEFIIDGAVCEQNPVVQEETVYQCPSLFTSKTLIELSCTSWTPHKVKCGKFLQPYLRGCKWSPDGTCCLSVVNNDGVHVFELPRDLYTGNVKKDRIIDAMNSVIHVKEAGLIYDFCWFPHMNSAIPESCCWLTTRQNGPVQLWDAYDGSLRCSYRGFDAVDQMEPAISVTFTEDGSRIIAGYRKYIRTFNVERPGRDFDEHSIQTPAACFDTSGNLLAVGSWNTSISLYSVNELGAYKSIGVMHGHGGGVTQVKFTSDGLHLVSGARKDNRLMVWDIRYYRRPLRILSREVDNNQRVYFDISSCGRHLVTGGTDGVLQVWDYNQVRWKSSLDTIEDHGDATCKFPLHKDSCNSVSIHPVRPILATGSGQFHHFESVFSPIKNSKIGVNNVSNSGTPMTTEKVVSEKVDVNNQNSIINLDTDSEESSSENSQSTTDEDMCHTDKCQNSLVFWWIGEVCE